MTEFLQINLERVTVPDSITRKRSIRPSGLAPDSHLKYDFDTFFYHAIREGEDIVLVAPKLLNFRRLFRKSSWDINGKPLPRPKIYSFYRHAIIRFKGAPSGSKLQVTFPDGSTRLTQIAPSELDFLSGLNCQMIISKDNDLECIRQQLTFHAAQCDVNGLCFIDNGSTAYDLEALKEVLTSVGLTRFVLISMPYKWGGINRRPANRELYLQTSAYNIARLQFLAQARGVLRIDSDEIMKPQPQGQSVFDLAQKAKLGFVRFFGSDRLPGSSCEAPFNFSDHIYPPAKGGIAANNWCLDPKGPLGRFQWRCHNLEHNILDRFQVAQGSFFYHCLDVGTGWKGGPRMNAARANTTDKEAQDFWQTTFLPNVTSGTTHKPKIEPTSGVEQIRLEP